MPERTIQLPRLRFSYKAIRELCKAINYVWTSQDEEQWKAIREGKTKGFLFSRAFIEQMKVFLKEAPKLVQSRLFDLNNIQQIDPDILTEPILKKLVKASTFHWEILEARAMKRVNTLERQLLRREKEIAKCDVELEAKGIILRDAERVLKQIKVEKQLKDRIKIENRKLRSLQSRRSEAYREMEQALEISDWSAKFEKGERRLMRKGLVQYLIGKWGMKYSGTPRMRSPLKVLTKDNIESHRRRDMTR